MGKATLHPSPKIEARAKALVDVLDQEATREQRIAVAELAIATIVKECAYTGTWGTEGGEQELRRAILRAWGLL